MLLFGVGNGLLMPTATLGSMSAAPLLVGSAAALVSCLRIGAGSMGSFVITTLPLQQRAPAWLRDFFCRMLGISFLGMAR